MINKLPFKSGFNRLVKALPRARKAQFFILIAVGVITAAFELATLASLTLFLSVLSEPSQMIRSAPYLMFEIKLRMEEAASIFFGAIVITSGLRLWMARLSHRFSFGLGHDVATSIHRRMLSQPYEWHMQRNSGDLITAFEKAHMLSTTVATNVVQACSALLIVIALIVGLITISPLPAVASFVAIILIYVAISIVCKKRLESNSRSISRNYSYRTKIIQESLGAIRHILLERSSEYFLKQFRSSDDKLRMARADNAFISQAPKFAVEGAAIILFSLSAILLVVANGDIASVIPVFGALALASQRLLPLVHQIYQAWSALRGHMDVLRDVLWLLFLPDGEGTAKRRLEPLRIGRELRLDGVTYRYPGASDDTVKGVSLSVARGSIFGVVGANGSGKSTLLDIMMGLLVPTTGNVTVDGSVIKGEWRERWKANVAHVPQEIFLADASIGENIAFGQSLEGIDDKELLDAASRANLMGLIEKLPRGLDAPVGERGVRLSGGERQRIGIARALFMQADVLFLDEPTSSLDAEAERDLLETLRRLTFDGITVVLIAHGATAISACDKVFRVEQ